MSIEVLEGGVASPEHTGRRAVESGTRNPVVDRIRVAMTALVILHHTAIVYGGSGGWFWRQEPNASNLLFVMFNTINQAYFMGLFFLLAGYYTPDSFRRKGAARFLADRLVRLGIPLLVFFFVLHPFTVAIARTADGHPFWNGWWQMIVARAFGPGPLWFAEALLIFALAYVGWRMARRSHEQPDSFPRTLPSAGTLALTAVTLGAISFAVRLVVPVGKEVLWLQLGYFPCYIYLFVAGCAAARSRLLERVTPRDALPWMIVSAAAILLLPVVMVTRGGVGAFEGGWTLNALFYALWDPLVAWGMILGLFWAAQRWRTPPTPLSDWLGRGAFGAYIIHPPIVVALSVCVATWSGSPWAKFALVGAAACGGSFMAASALRTIPGVRRVI